MSSTVEDWLRSLGLIQYTQAFLDNGYDELDICKEIGEEDLDAIGVKNIKDRVDILSAVNRLRQSGTAVYFVLEEGSSQPPPCSKQSREKLLPLKLKMFLHDTLAEDNIKLSEPPYTLENGLRGNLETLITLYADKFYTYEEDVFEALESIRVRQVGEMQAQLLQQKQFAESSSPSIESKSGKHHHKRSNTTPIQQGTVVEPSGWNTVPSSMKNKDNRVVDPADYLDVDTRSSPHKKVKRRRPVERNSKLSRSLDSLKELHVNTDMKTKADKDTSTNKPKQSSSIFGIFRSSKRKTYSLEEKSPDSKSNSSSSTKSTSDYPTASIMMSEEDRVALMLMVKNGELTVEEAVQQIESYENEQRKLQTARHETRTSSSCSEEDSPKGHHKLKRGLFGRSTKKKTPSRPGSEIAACDMTMSEEERINLMKGVRDHEITIEDAVQRLYSFEENHSHVQKPKPKPKFSPKSPHSFSRLSIKRVSGAFNKSKDEPSSVFYTPTEDVPRTSSEDDNTHPPSDSSPDPSPAGHRKLANNLVRNLQQNQIHSTSSLHSSSSSSDAVDRLGSSEDSGSPVKRGFAVHPGNQCLDEMKHILSQRGSLEKEENQFPSKTSSLPRNVKPRNTSLSRKGSLPITPTNKPPPPPVRKAPLPPPRPFQKQVTAPALYATSSGNDVSHTIAEVPEKQEKWDKPVVPPRKKSFDDVLKTELEEKLSSCGSNQELDQSSRFANQDKLLKTSPLHNKTIHNVSNRDSLDDDVFPPLPPEVVQESEHPKKTIIKPPRPSLKQVKEKAVMEDELETTTIVGHAETKPPPAPPPTAAKPVPVPPPQEQPSLPHHETSSDENSPAHPPPKPFSVPARKPPTIPPPNTKPKPAVKKKPRIPPRPPAKPGASAKDEEHDQDGAGMAQDQGSSLDVPEFPVPRKRPSHSLSDLIERRLRIEQIDLTEMPYTQEDGSWGIPINLVDRYTEEMRRSQKEIVEILDRIRCLKLKENGRQSVSCNVNLFPQEPDHLGAIDSVESWLVSLGLPMYIDNLREVEYDDMSTMPFLKQKHFEYAGVVDLRHMRRLLASVERMPR